MNKIEVQNLYNEIMKMIAKKEDVEKIKEKIKEYSKEKMLFSFQGQESKVQINEIAEYIIEFINKAYAKGYLNDENIYENLEKITIKNFKENCNAYGEYLTDGTLRLNLRKNAIPNNIGLKHIVFHELAHAITPEIGGDGGKYRELRTKNIPNKLNIPNFYEPIFVGDARTFLREVIAEATACDLADDYEFVPTIVEGAGFSDWLVPLNRRYQAIGDDFLKTISGNYKSDKYSSRERFKKLTLEAMKPDNSIVEDIMNKYAEKNPRTWKEDIHKITSIFSEIYLSKNPCQVDSSKVKMAREIMQKYLPHIVLTDQAETPKITIQNSTEKPKIEIHNKNER